MTKYLLTLWNRIWFSAIDPLPMAACRIGLGLLLTVWFIGLSPNWERFYAADGIISLNDKIIAGPPTIDEWNVMQVTEGVLPTRAYWVVGLVASVTLAIGFCSRISSALLFAIINILVRRNTYVVNGEEMVARIFLLYGMFAPWGYACSVDAWLRKRFVNSANSSNIATPWAWSLRMMQIHFLLIYTISLGYKFAQDSAWIEGDALHWTIASDRWWRMGEMSWITLSLGGLLRKWMTYGTILIEGTAPILIWFRPTRRYVIGAIFFLHIGIAIMIPGVVFFSLLMVVGVLNFVPAETYRQIAVSVSRFARKPFAVPQPKIRMAAPVH